MRFLKPWPKSCGKCAPYTFVHAWLKECTQSVPGKVKHARTSCGSTVVDYTSAYPNKQKIPFFNLRRRHKSLGGCVRKGIYCKNQTCSYPLWWLTMREQLKVVFTYQDILKKYSDPNQGSNITSHEQNSIHQPCTIMLDEVVFVPICCANISCLLNILPSHSYIVTSSPKNQAVMLNSKFQKWERDIMVPWPSFIYSLWF